MNNKTLYGIIAFMFICMCVMGYKLYQQDKLIKDMQYDISNNESNIMILETELSNLRDNQYTPPFISSYW